MKHERSNPPDGFNGPTSLPEDADQGQRWQQRNRAWWESQPMRYDWREELGMEEFSAAFYQEIDRRFFKSSEEYLPYQEHPFEGFIDFQALKDQDVLEIGVGNGSHAQLLASHAKSYTGIDLTEYAVKSTSKRLEVFGVEGQVMRMDAELMDFADEQFDFIWTWGVIHHSSDTARIMEQMQRVLRPGGRAVVMVYYRSLWNYYILNGLLSGLLSGDLFKTRSLNKTAQRNTDGAIARYYTIAEWDAFAAQNFQVERTEIYGQKANVFPIPGGRIKTMLMNLMPNGLSRFLTHRCKMGDFLVSFMSKQA